MSFFTRKLAGVLLVISGVTHVAQIAFYAAENHTIGAAVGGVVYLLIGILLFSGSSRIALWLGALLPALGGVGGVYRFIYLQSNPLGMSQIRLIF